jgi:hypothetical protein
METFRKVKGRLTPVKSSRCTCIKACIALCVGCESSPNVQAVGILRLVTNAFDFLFGHSISVPRGGLQCCHVISRNLLQWTTVL